MAWAALTFGLNVNPVQSVEIFFFITADEGSLWWGILCPFQMLRGRRNEEITVNMKAPLGRAKCSDVTHLIKVSTCRSFQGLYPLASALTNCDQFCTCEVNVCSDDIDPSLLPCTGVIRDRAWPLGAETDGSSSFWSEHKAPEHSLQSVVPVLNIDRSKALPRYRAI